MMRIESTHRHAGNLAADELSLHFDAATDHLATSLGQQGEASQGCALLLALKWIWQPG
jgi:hypothetical protein